MADRILPEYDVVTDKELGEAVGQAIGAASVCWDPMDCTGVFMSERANQLCDELFGVIRQFTTHHLDQVEQKLTKIAEGKEGG
jgi:Zn-finger protein